MSVLLGIVAWVVLTACYFLFAGEISGHEALAGLPTAAAGSGFVLALHHCRERRFRLRAPWLRVLGRPLAAVFPDAARVGGVLLRAALLGSAGPRGEVVRQPFRHGGHRARDAARRGLVTLAASFAPNGFVLRVPEGQAVLLLHRLAPAPPQPDREWPV